MNTYSLAPGHRDPLLQDLAHLRSLAPDPERARQVRARCHAVLTRRRQRSRRAEHVIDFVQRIMAPATLGVLCVLYTIALFVLAF
jgi:hypothetical protein